MNTHAYSLDSVLLPVHENGNSSTEMGGKNKNRNKHGATDNNESSKDQEIAEVTTQSKELNKKIDRLLELLAKEKEDGAEGKGAASAAAQKKKEEAQKAAETKKQEEARKKAEEKKTEAAKAGDSLDSEWEIVPKGQRDRKKSEKQLAEETIHGSTLPPTPTGAAPVRTAASEAEPEHPDGPDPRDWNVDIKDVTGKARLKVGQAGLVWAQTAQEVTATLHDLQATDQPAAMLSYEKADPASILSPVRM